MQTYKRKYFVFVCFSFIAISDMKTLKKVTNFPYEVLVEGRVIYDQNVHIDTETIEDDITIYVTDGINQSPSRDISVFFSVSIILKIRRRFVYFPQK